MRETASEKAGSIMKYWLGGCVAVAVIAVAAVAIASSSPQRAKAAAAGRSDFAIFSPKAQAESGGSSQMPAGAVLAATSNADGQVNRIYAWERAAGEYCMVDLEGPEARTTVCSSRSEAEQSGLLLAEKSDEYAGTNVVAMVPDGVTSVTFTDGGGATHTVAVANNVVDYANAGGIIKASFTMPNGKHKETTF